MSLCVKNRWVFWVPLYLLTSLTTVTWSLGSAPCQAVFGASSPSSLIVVSAPSGGGKTTLVRMLVADFPEQYAMSVSLTTRPPRGQEKDGQDYHFVTQAEFQKRIESGDLLEWASVHGNYYGTSKSQIEAHQKAGRTVFLVIDVQGAANLRAIPGLSENLKTIFISPPSLKILEARLRARGTDDEATIQKRLTNAKGELARKDEFDAVVINGDLNTAYQDFVNAVLK